MEPIAPPARIWLQPDPDDESVTEISDCSTWCQDKIGVNDIEYVLAGSVPDLTEVLQRLAELEKRSHTYCEDRWY